MRTALVTGGSGYLGSHLGKALKKAGYYTVCFDIKTPQNDLYWDVYHPGDIRSYQDLSRVFTNWKPDIVFHLAGRIEVGESVLHPEEFWDVNVGGTCNLLHTMRKFDVSNIVYSSTAGVYRSQFTSLSEKAEIDNNNPYANSKYAAECAIRDAKVNSIIFRFFNLAGADPDCEMGEEHEPETHLIPRILQNLNTVEVYGNDYDTQDGTCVRDYVHVCDVVDAHLEAEKYLDNYGESGVFNLGSGVGYSVLDVIKTVEKVSSKKVKYNIVPRRKGDPSHLVADITKAKTILNFNPKHDISSIIKSAYEWEETRSTT